MNRIFTLSVGLGIIAFMLLLCQPAVAAGIGIGPNEVAINQATRGGTYERSITVFNPSEESVKVNLRTEGAAGEWITLYRLDEREIPISEVSIPARSNSQLLFKVAVPEDAPTETYQARIVVETQSEQAMAGGVGTVLRARTMVTIHVIGREIVSGKVEGINVANTETGVPLVISVQFRNTGNVIVSPEIHSTITKDGAVIGEAHSSEKRVTPETIETILVELATDDLEPGTYTARVVGLLRGEQIASQETDFEVFPYGQLSREGTMGELQYEGMMQTGLPIKLSGIFTNTGRIATRAVLNAEVYRDGSFINAISGDTVLVPVGGTSELFSYVTVPEPGEYQIKYWALYEGQRTETNEITLRVSEGGLSAEPQASPISPVSVIGSAMMLFVVATRGWLKRRR